MRLVPQGQPARRVAVVRGVVQLERARVLILRELIVALRAEPAAAPHSRVACIARAAEEGLLLPVRVRHAADGVCLVLCERADRAAAPVSRTPFVARGAVACRACKACKALALPARAIAHAVVRALQLDVRGVRHERLAVPRRAVGARACVWVCARERRVEADGRSGCDEGRVVGERGPIVVAACSTTATRFRTAGRELRAARRFHRRPQHLRPLNCRRHSPPHPLSPIAAASLALAGRRGGPPIARDARWLQSPTTSKPTSHWHISTPPELTPHSPCPEHECGHFATTWRAVRASRSAANALGRDVIVAILQ